MLSEPENGYLPKRTQKKHHSQKRNGDISFLGSGEDKDAHSYHFSSIRYGVPGQGNDTQKGNKKCKDWKRKDKIAIVCR